MKPLGPYLEPQRDEEKAGENHRTDEVTKIHRHRYSIASRLAQRGRDDFDQPKSECQRRDVFQGVVCVWPPRDVSVDSYNFLGGAEADWYRRLNPAAPDVLTS
jgi:hypothetical protein